MKIELLAPAGSMEKLQAAVYFGADACYFAGKQFGLRSYSANFTNAELKKAVQFLHSNGKKAYITVNILAHNRHLKELPKYLEFLQSINVDGVIVSDLGVMELCKKHCPNVDIQISTQASVTNIESVKMYKQLGAKRIILSRELSLKEIAEIKKAVDIELESFVHGAMCISYSGRCLLSSFFLGRSANLGECAQPCRFEYNLTEVKRPNEPFTMQEDINGTYILNSKDLCMVKHLKKLADAGITCFKIEGRMKSAYYVANTVNAYRRQLDVILSGAKNLFNLEDELLKASHRDYTTGFYFGKNNEMQRTDTGHQIQSYDVVANILSDAKNGLVKIEHRNKFVLGDVVEILSPNETFNKTFKIEKILDENKQPLDVANKVQAVYYINCPFELKKGDILRKETKE